jgi:C4-dicarboxylate transporter
MLPRNPVRSFPPTTHKITPRIAAKLGARLVCLGTAAYPRDMRAIIFPAMAVVWGVAIVIYGVASLSGGTYGGGQAAAMAFGVILVALGTRALIKAKSERDHPAGTTT